MPKYSGDVRERVRNQIGTVWDYDSDGIDEYCITVSDDFNDTLYIPMYLPAEMRGGEVPYMPAIEMLMVSSPETSMDVSGKIKFQESYFDFHLYYPNNLDNISGTTFGRLVADEICQKIHTNRASVSSNYFVEVINSGFEIVEPSSEGVVFHRVIECKAINYN